MTVVPVPEKYADKINAFNENFVWRNDTFDGWRVLKKPDDAGNYVGDCDDYANTVSWILSDNNRFKMWWNLLMGKHKIWYCRTKESNAFIQLPTHVVLYVEGLGWTDNIHKTFVTQLEPYYKLNFNTNVFIWTVKSLIGVVFK